MDIRPEEIELVENCGSLNNEQVKLIKTKGGFWVAVGKKHKNSGMESLAMGSHRALVSYQVEKQFKGFEPIMMKSESDGVITNLDKLLKNNNNEFSMSALNDNLVTTVSLFDKSGIELSTCTFIKSEDSLKINSVKGTNKELIRPYLAEIVKELVG